jgi:hypothetical protein
MSMSPRLLRPRASGGFDPKSIAGLIAWFDAADAMALGPTSSGVGAVSNNGPVKFLKDKSESGLNLTQAGADSVAPTFLSSSQNGLPALSFDGLDRIDTSDGNVVMTAPFTFFLVAKANITGTTRACGIDSVRSIGPFGSGNTQWGFFSAGGIKSFNVSATSASVLAMTCTPSLGVVLYGNGVQAESGTASSVSASGFALGAQASGSTTFLTGLVYECLSYNSVLSSLRLNAVSKYLGKKWGVTVA